MFLGKKQLACSFGIGCCAGNTTWCLLCVSCPYNQGLLLKQAYHCDFAVSAMLLALVITISDNSCMNPPKADHCMVRSWATVPPVASTIWHLFSRFSSLLGGYRIWFASSYFYSFPGLLLFARFVGILWQAAVATVADPQRIVYPSFPYKERESSTCLCHQFPGVLGGVPP